MAALHTRRILTFRVLRVAAVLIGLTLPVVRCETAKPPDADEADAELTELVTTESGAVANAADMFLGSDGRLYVADYQSSYVLAIDTASGALTQIGRPGSGPSEFQQPTGVREQDGILTVFDSRNGRIVKLTLDGQMIGSVAVNAFPYAPAASIDAQGWIMTATGGFQHGLAVLLDDEGRTVRGYGEPVDLPESFTPADVKEELRRGRVPALFQNNVVPARGEDDAVYLAMMASPEIRRYSAQGTLMWSVTLTDPAQQGLREGYVQRNVEEENPNRVHPFRYFIDVQASPESLWFLGSPDANDTVIWQLDPGDGAVRARHRFGGVSGITAFLVDESSRTVFLADNDLGRILKGRLGPNTASRVSSVSSSIP
jgi:hypothetical protein